jgi:hypothetical protein
MDIFCGIHHHQPINVHTAGGTGLPYGLYIRRTGHTISQYRIVDFCAFIRAYSIQEFYVRYSL